MQDSTQLSPFSNTEGGRLLVGIKDNGKIAGIRSAEEIYMVEVAATRYCRPSVTLDSQIYKVDGKDVLEVSVAESQHKPVYAVDEDKKPKAYIRIKDETILASPVHLDIWRHDHKDVMIRCTNGSSASCAFWRSMARLRLTGVSDCRIFPAVR